MIASSDITNAFPELTAVAGSTWTWAIAQAYSELVSGDTLTFPVAADVDKAALLLAAHYAQLATASFPKGLVSEQHVGSVGRSTAIPNMDPDDYSLTPYGVMFKRLIRHTVNYWCVG